LFSVQGTVTLLNSVVDPDPKKSEPLCRSRIRSRISGAERFEYKFYFVKLDFACFKNVRYIMTSTFVEKRTAVPKIAFLKR